MTKFSNAKVPRKERNDGNYKLRLPQHILDQLKKEDVDIAELIRERLREAAQALKAK